MSELHKNPAINVVAVNGPYQGFIVVATLNESTPSPQGISYLHFIELITPLGYCFMPMCVICAKSSNGEEGTSDDSHITFQLTFIIKIVNIVCCSNYFVLSGRSSRIFNLWMFQGEIVFANRRQLHCIGLKICLLICSSAYITPDRGSWCKQL